jgi:radical SAM superfamily enzyme YgiQ (UPF0313 family)
LGRYLVEHGIDVKIVDFYLDEVKSFDVDIVGISSTFMSVEDVKQIAERVREENPSATIVLGGPLSWSVLPDQLLHMVPSLDYIVMREGEQTFSELIHLIGIGGDPSTVRGLVFLRNDAVVKTPTRTFLDSKEIPQPFWELMDIPCIKRLPVLPVETSRGCPFNCAYCSEVTYWGKPVRYRSDDDVIRELRHNTQVLGITSFRFTDSCFSAPPNRCARLCDSIYENFIKQDIPLKWSSYARIDTLDYTLLEKMKRSGCIALDIGVESGSSKVLSLMGRSYSTELVVEVAQAARDIGIITNFNVVIGFPGETAETVEATAELIDCAAPDTYACFLFFLAPNTRVDASRSKYRVEGSGLAWRHDTMMSEEAQKNMIALTEKVSHSTNFPGGEYFACYLASVGYSVEEITNFYHAVRRLVESPDDKQALLTVRMAVEKVRDFW